MSRASWGLHSGQGGRGPLAVEKPRIFLSFGATFIISTIVLHNCNTKRKKENYSWEDNTHCS
jgi:hypothetical protein